MKTKETIFSFLAILILGSGLALYVWNKMHGKDLSQPPNFDLSVYEDYGLPGNITQEIDNELTPIIEKIANKNEAKIEEKQSEIIENLEFETGYIYFKDSFRLASVNETNNLIKSFLKDFPELKGVYIDNLETQKTVKIELPALNREDMLKTIKANPDVFNVEVVEAPVWQVEFKEGKKEIAVADFFKNFTEIKVQTLLSRTIEGYVARIKISDLKLEQTILDKLGKEYSDVLKIVP